MARKTSIEERKTSFFHQHVSYLPENIKSRVNIQENTPDEAE
jgi:hypothetical protein